MKGAAAAKSVALKHAGLSASQVSELEVELDRDHATVKYEVEFKSGAVIRFEKVRDD